MTKKEILRGAWPVNLPAYSLTRTDPSSFGTK